MWVDLLVEEILKTRSESAHLVNDAWSPSGYAHVGSLKGVVLHDAITRGLRERGVPVRFIYGFDDYDPLDSVPPYLDRERFAPHLGKPLSDVPSPQPNARSYGEFFSRAFIDDYQRLGCRNDPYFGSELYRSGRMNDAIRLVLDRAAEVMQIDRETSGSRRAERHPLQVICERCGQIATTLVSAWDGREVTYDCLAEKVAWARGCGHHGRRSPFDGGAKLIYRVEWAAKWWTLGVTVEGAGKDHMTRGGSHDTASAIVRRIFDYPPPFAIAYEFLLIGGAKMSGSTGLGLLARELHDILRPELARFIFVRPHYKEQKNFDPGGDTIPRLYDEYDKAASAALGQIEDPELARTFLYSTIDGERPAAYRPRFSKVASLVQLPHVDLREAVEREKGAPLTPEEQEELRARVEDARRWLDGYAPDTFRFTVQASLPDAARSLTPEQQAYLAALAESLAREPWQGDALHARIHEAKAQRHLSPQQAFQAIYRVFLGKDSGPQAGWLLAALDRDFVLSRLREAAGAGAAR